MCDMNINTLNRVFSHHITKESSSSGIRSGIRRFSVLVGMTGKVVYQFVNVCILRYRDRMLVVYIVLFGFVENVELYAAGKF